MKVSKTKIIVDECNIAILDLETYTLMKKIYDEYIKREKDCDFILVETIQRGFDTEYRTVTVLKDSKSIFEKFKEKERKRRKELDFENEILMKRLDEKSDKIEEIKRLALKINIFNFWNFKRKIINT